MQTIYKYQLSFNFILDVPPVKQGIRQFWTLTSATVNGCGITLYHDYVPMIWNSNYTLELLNSKGMVFNTYSIDELSDRSGYDRLDELYALVKDSVYQITESERKILEGLEELAVKKNM